jgi:hypothetical protein
LFLAGDVFNFKKRGDFMAKMKYWNGTTWEILDAKDADTVDGKHFSDIQNDAQAKANAALNSAKQYTDQEVGEVSQALATKETPAGAQAKAEAAAGAVRVELNSHLSKSAIHKTSDVIRTETNTQLKVEVVSSSVSATPDAGRIIFDTSQGKFFGGNGTGWV